MDRLECDRVQVASIAKRQPMARLIEWWRPSHFAKSLAGGAIDRRRLSRIVGQRQFDLFAAKRNHVGPIVVHVPPFASNQYSLSSAVSAAN